MLLCVGENDNRRTSLLLKRHVLQSEGNSQQYLFHTVTYAVWNELKETFSKVIRKRTQERETPKDHKWYPCHKSGLHWICIGVGWHDAELLHHHVLQEKLLQMQEARVCIILCRFDSQWWRRAYTWRFCIVAWQTTRTRICDLLCKVDHFWSLNALWMLGFLYQ